MLVALDLLFGLLPGFAWLIFYLGEDPHPEPKRLIALTFFAGIAFGFFTIIVEQIFNMKMGQLGIDEFSIVSLFGLAMIEEVMKFSAAYFAVGKSPDLDEPIDRMVYMVVAALGFATLENLGAITNIPLHGAVVFSAVLETASLRFVGATLLHSLTSAIVGYHWAKGVVQNKVVKGLLVGFICAATLHTIFNYLILNYGSVVYTIVFLVIVGFFVLNDFEKLKGKKV
jgi:RsiW-degrading membrane proteinase PrsW (M82 family)